MLQFYSTLSTWNLKQGGKNLLSTRQRSLPSNPRRRRLLGAMGASPRAESAAGPGGAGSVPQRGAAAIPGREFGWDAPAVRPLCRAGAEGRCPLPSAPLPPRVLTGLVPSRDFPLPLKFKPLIFLAANPPPGEGRSLSPRPEGGAWRRPGATQPRRTHRPPRLINTGGDGTGRDGGGGRDRAGLEPPRRAE
ncbi:PREDICTED: translation initiation factor IF-2-like [Ficedula albicollis]|uniref:translation initiation factor IF-2-like n=1 Tax=Ficedula albicollis TaxID=59894 RepID=UPI0007AD7F9B|nr:PREDICTED: translation initiation factor IF-2-like [Ficedula albicollis]